VTTNISSEYEDKIREFLGRDILFTDDFPYGDDASFIEQSIVDSMGVIQVVMFVQSAFGIQVDPGEITRENFDSVRKLAAYVRGKSAALPG